LDAALRFGFGAVRFNPLIRQGFKNPPVAYSRPRFPGGGDKIQQGPEGKGPFPEPGMGNGKVLFPDKPVPEKKYVDVQGPFPPAAFPLAVPAAGGFHGLNRGQQLPGTAPVPARHGGVTKVGLIRHSHRRRRIHRGQAAVLQQAA
jgi:hypothetical protein